MIKEIIEQNIGQIIWAVVILILGFGGLHIYKIRKIIDSDKSYKKINENGQLIEEGHLRSIWDYSIFPGLTKLWFDKAGWQTALALFAFVLLLIVYLFTRENILLNILGINLGVFFGMMLKKE